MDTRDNGPVDDLPRIPRGVLEDCLACGCGAGYLTTLWTKYQCHHVGVSSILNFASFMQAYDMRRVMEMKSNIQIQEIRFRGSRMAGMPSRFSSHYPTEYSEVSERVSGNGAQRRERNQWLVPAGTVRD